ncbi:MAG: hypothetical protein WBB01_07055 [Phormidesmis sp.]
MNDEFKFRLHHSYFILPKRLAQDCRTASGALGALTVSLGFPEFESFHLINFSIKAQIPKSAASTIPPRPLQKRKLDCSQVRQITIPPPSGLGCNRFCRQISFDQPGQTIDESI